MENKTKLKRSDSQESKMSVSTVQSKNYGDKANDQLYDIFKKFDSGKIDCDGFVKSVESNVGIPATPEFVSYIRTQKHTKCSYSKIAQTLNYKRDQKQNSTYNPPMNPYDQNFHRYGTKKKSGPSGSTMNAFQEQMAKTISDYTKGSINANKFKEQLYEYNIPVDATMDKLIRKHESGDFVSYNDFGKQIFRQLNGTETYNRVDKINMNNLKIVSPEKTGQNHFALANEIKQPHSRDLDNLHIEQQQRHVSTVYVPKKGQSNIKGVNQLQSSISTIMKIEENKKSAQPHEDFSNPSKRIDLRDRQGSDIFGFSNATESKDFGGKKKVTSHAATTTNGNLTYWDK